LGLLAGCANPATQAQLRANNAACAAGDPDACTAAHYTAQQAAVEAQQNGNAAVVGAGALAILGVIAATAHR
jgi:threonine dehydrogenase-like Zn-dependent dehydrogenase